MKSVFTKYVPYAVITALLCVLLSFSCSAATNSQIDSSKKRITSNKEKISQIEKEQKELKGKIEELNSLKSDAAEYIAGLDRQEEEIDAEIVRKTAEVEETEEAIRELEERVASTEEKIASQKEGMALRIRYMYESGHTEKLDRILADGNAEDALNSTEYVNKVTEFDRQKLEEFKELKNQLNAEKEELASELEVLDAQKADLEEKYKVLITLEEQKAAEISAYEEKIGKATEQSQALSTDATKLKNAIKAEEAKIAAIEAELKRKEEEERKKAAAMNQKLSLKSIGELKFKWPVPSSSRVTSEFGKREAPVAGASTTHKGIDIGASSGSDIVAAEDGTVVIATYSESAGNYVMISHGNGIYTVYMHMKKISVSVDQKVSKGDVIGTVGSTGYSTGPHLHFGIRVSGEYVDPLLYVNP